MHSTVFSEGTIETRKLNQPLYTENIVIGSSCLKRLHIREISSGPVYLIDTGSDVSGLLFHSEKLSQRTRFI